MIAKVARFVDHKTRDKYFLSLPAKKICGTLSQ